MVVMDDSIEHLDFLPPGFKYLPCKYCGRMILVGDRTRKLPHHLECSMQVAIDTVRQMAAKEGPYYERWKQSMRRYAEREGWGAAPPVDGEGTQPPLT
jgi:hypothetical protein